MRSSIFSFLILSFYCHFTILSPIESACFAWPVNFACVILIKTFCRYTSNFQCYWGVIITLWCTQKDEWKRTNKQIENENNEKRMTNKQIGESKSSGTLQLKENFPEIYIKVIWCNWEESWKMSNNFHKSILIENELSSWTLFMFIVQFSF